MAVPAMDDLADRYTDRGVTSAFVYTREAHPGERYGPHTSMEVKRSHALAFREEVGVRRRILIDDLAGTAHRAFHPLPNLTYVIARGGMISYKAGWTDPDDVARFMDHTLDRLEARRAGEVLPMVTEQIAWRRRDDEGFRRGLERSGPQAIADFDG